MSAAPPPRIVVAIGGNALLHRGEAPNIANQRANVANAARVLAELADHHGLVVTHGNGPQVGLLARQSEAVAGVDPVPFDVLVAESEGLIGYLLAEEIGRQIGEARVVVLLTLVVVDRRDPAFGAPSKPIGAMLTEEEARLATARYGWAIMRDGAGWRRAVASPEPLEIIELAAIRSLMDAGYVVVCAGGGGIPVARYGDGVLRGVEAVIDKDMTSSLLATALGADQLLILTDVDNVIRDYGGADPRPITDTTPADLRAMNWAAGSMGPKIEAACRFVERTGNPARIGGLDHAAEVLAGRSGTCVFPDPPR
ncbi:MAG TPA: carbamate kinase [Ilumatobacteraceae bacterium]|nr:carbamate kinase [Ilumatobacteraceae bacterium]